MAFAEDVDAKRSTGNWGILDIQSRLTRISDFVHLHL